jgi:hypothetical protein
MPTHHSMVFKVRPTVSSDTKGVLEFISTNHRAASPQ